MKAVTLPIVCHPRWFGRIAVGLLLAHGGCSRTGLDPGEGLDGLDEHEPTGAGGALHAGGRSPSAASGFTAVAGKASIAAGGETPAPAGCTPSSEACNGRDDDCNGTVDDLPPQACDGGGFRLCVAGRMSECPRRCDVCVPGSVRICQNSFCTFWGEQQCAADGQGFGRCRETEPPPECAAVAREYEDSVELEQCCVDNGYCCLDEHDLDDDGSRSDLLGACGDVTCR